MVRHFCFGSTTALIVRRCRSRGIQESAWKARPWKGQRRCTDTSWTEGPFKVKERLESAVQCSGQWTLPNWTAHIRKLPSPALTMAVMAWIHGYGQMIFS